MFVLGVLISIRSEKVKAEEEIRILYHIVYLREWTFEHRLYTLLYTRHSSSLNGKQSKGDVRTSLSFTAGDIDRPQCKEFMKHPRPW